MGGYRVSEVVGAQGVGWMGGLFEIDLLYMTQLSEIKDDNIKFVILTTILMYLLN